MVQDVYDPLTEYINVFHNRFKEVAEETFSKLAKEAKIDVEANRETCRQQYATERSLASVKERMGWWIVLCVVLWLAILGGCITAYLRRAEWKPWMFVALGVFAVLMLTFLFVKVHRKVTELKSERNLLAQKVLQLKQEALEQMQPLNALYDWDILTRMMNKTVPRLEFDPYFTTQRLADLQTVYGWDGSFNKGRSVLFTHSGLINGNPFVIVRTRKMEMESKTYYGHKTIYWTTREKGADGKYQTVHHSETLTASVTAPFQCYYEKTRLIYGNTAAPDLVFYRKQSGLAGREDTLSFKWKRRSLRKKARNLRNQDFAMLTNEDFETAFDTSNRNNNQQFALLFTPLAQESMLKLLKDYRVGYGDDFDFDKNRMINTIIPQHLQAVNLELIPEMFTNSDFDKAKADFYTYHAAYFRSFYFALAPLLCVPMYQQIRSQEDIYGKDMAPQSSFWEHEALANFWGSSNFKHPSCVTDCILKTKKRKERGTDNSIITVYAYGYRTEQRVSYISQYGGDGHFHKVPVYWDEYLPVTGTGTITMREDNDYDDSDKVKQKQRLRHINKVLKESNFSIYRRHIVSRVECY